MTVLRILIINSLIFYPFLISGQTDNQKLAELFDQIATIDEEVSNSVYRGQHPEVFTWLTIEDIKNRNKEYRRLLTEMNALPANQLSRQDEISRSVMQMRLLDRLAEEDYQLYLMPYNAEGGFFNRLVRFIPRLPFSSAEDFENYLKWLPSYVDYFKDHQERMREGASKGITGPKVVVRNLMKLTQPFLEDNWLEHPFGRPFADRPSDITQEQWSSISTRGKEVLENQIINLYRSFYDFLENDYLPKSPEKVGIDGIKGGRDYYANRIRHYTTLDITPDSVFQLGMSEVKRIDARMKEVMKEVGFDGSFAEFLQFLRTDEQFYAKTPQELLNRAAWISKRAEAHLPRLFLRLYSLPYTVEPVPEAIAPTYTAGRYSGGSWDEQRPGAYWVNTFDLKSRTLYTLPALSLHEAVPGHHLQNALAAESDLEVPPFRKDYYISAFGEGWGLYSEYLGEEMGIYETPYELFGRYTYEMWRACRLVVDVGMHAKDWTREEAVTFMADHTALSLREVNTEIDRYIGWPGQAVSYKVGEITIKRLRAQAEAELGDQFDVREFHYHLLKNGSVPLPELVLEIENYVSEIKQNTLRKD